MKSCVGMKWNRVNLPYSAYVVSLIANIVHTSLNPRGGGERLAVATIKALAAMGIDVELATYEKPSKELLHNFYGESIEHCVKEIKTLGMLGQLHGRMPAGRCDVVVNTHGDMLPFFRENFTKKNAITYCHYPIAGHLMDCGDPRLRGAPPERQPVWHDSCIL